MRKYGVCVIGCGDRGTVHAKEWLNRHDIDVISICDTNESARDKVASLTGAPGFTDYRQAIEQPGVDIVSVCVPTYLHQPVSCFAAERGKHIFSEKPFALTLEEGNRIAETVRNSGVVYSLCFQHRDRALFTRLRNLYVEGAFGGPVFFRFDDIREVRPKTAMHRRSMNGGVVIDMACHVFDLAGYITGEKITSVFASGHVFGEGKKRLEGIDDLAIDEVNISARLSGGHHLSTYINWGMPEGFSTDLNRCWLLGPDMCTSEKDGTLILRGKKQEEVELEKDPGTRVRIDRFVSALAGNPLDITLEDGMTALRCSHAALRSIQTGQVEEIE